MTIWRHVGKQGSVSVIYKRFARHIFVWCIFISYEIISIRLATGMTARPVNYLLFYGLNLTLFYVNALFVLPHAFRRPRLRYLAAACLLAMEMGLYLFIKIGVDRCLDEIRSGHYTAILPGGTYLVYNLWRGVYFLGCSTLYWSIVRLTNYRQQAIIAENRQLNMMIKQADLQKKLGEIRNSYLQQQINHIFYSIPSISFTVLFTLIPRSPPIAWPSSPK